MAETSWRGVLAAIHLADGASQPMRALAGARLVAGIGIAGDRYAERRGTYSTRHHIDRQVTLIEQETLDALARDHGVELAPHEHRRNMTTRGVPLNHLVGRYFRVGECVLYGGRLNVPCRYLEELLNKKVFKLLINRSGLNARVISGGTLRTGDAVVPLDPASVSPDLRETNERHGLEPPPEV
ncbi:MAG: MOSC domain-containing protein [Betaproteobacteria bacterium]|nr:MAG: MOSC domain-containing protein [Betaproteobacteria bacterium]